MDETSKWTRWYDLETPSKKADPRELQEHFGKHFGIYQIRIVDANGCPIRLGRMLKCDELGVVYIGRSGFGQTRTVVCRLQEWLRRGHSGACTYKRFKDALPLNHSLNNHSLQVSALYLSASEVQSKEAEEIDTYRKQFGEPPPFNSSIPDKK